GRSFLAVGTTPAALVPSLASAGVAWLGLVALGVVVFPILIVEALAAPPVSTFFFDLFVPANTFGLTAFAFVVTLVLTVARALLWSVLVGMFLEWSEYRTVTLVGVLRGLQSFPAVLGIMAVN